MVYTIIATEFLEYFFIITFCVATWVVYPMFLFSYEEEEE